MQTTININRMLLLEAKSILENSRGGWIFLGVKRTKKKNLLRFFGSNDKNNFKPTEKIIFN